MVTDELKSIKEVDRELAEKADRLEEEIKQAEAKHPSRVADDVAPSA